MFFCWLHSLLAISVLVSNAMGSIDIPHSAFIFGVDNQHLRFRTGKDKCYCPTLDRTLSYKLETQASWSLGSLSTQGLSDINFGATVMVSSYLHQESEDQVSWFHHIRVENIFSVKTKSPTGNFFQPASVLVTPPMSASDTVEAWFQQFECDDIESFHYSENLEPQLRNFLQGTAEMFPFAVPVDEEISKYRVFHNDFNGRSPRGTHLLPLRLPLSDFSLKRWIAVNANGDHEQKMEIERKFNSVWETVSEQESFGRREDSSHSSHFLNGLVIGITSDVDVVLSPVEQVLRRNAHEKKLLSAKGKTSLSLIRHSTRVYERKPTNLLSKPFREFSLPNNNVSSIAFEDFFAFVQSNLECLDEEMQEIENSSGTKVAKSQRSAKCMLELISSLRKNSDKLDRLVSFPELIGNISCCSRTGKAFIHAVAWTATPKSVQIFEGIVHSVRSLLSFHAQSKSAEDCIIFCLTQVHLVKNPSKNLFQLVHNLALEDWRSRVSSCALLALGSIGKNAKVRSRLDVAAAVATFLKSTMRQALERDSIHQKQYINARRNAQEYFESSSFSLRINLLAKVRNLNTNMAAADWRRRSHYDKEAWTDEVISWIAQQVEFPGLCRVSCMD